MYPDFKDLIALLNKHKVKYLIVGGYAVALHAQPRATKDLDILIQSSPRNARAIYAALVEFGAPLRTREEPENAAAAPARKLTVNDFAEKGTWYTMGVPPVAIDILQDIPGINFDKAWKKRVTVIIDAETGLKAHFISREDLIIAKQAAGRERDKADAAELLTAASKNNEAANVKTPKPRRARKKAQPEP